jgi:hypothetical protein
VEPSSSIPQRNWFISFYHSSVVNVLLAVRSGKSRTCRPSLTCHSRSLSPGRKTACYHPLAAPSNPAAAVAFLFPSPPSARRIPLPAGIPQKGRPLKHDALRYESVVYRTSVAPSNSFRPFWQLLSAARRAASATRFSEPGQSQPASDNATCGARFTAPFSRLRSPDFQANRLSTQPVRLPASSGHKSAGYPITPDPSNPRPVDLHQLPAHLPATCCTALLFKVLPQTI